MYFWKWEHHHKPTKKFHHKNQVAKDQLQITNLPGQHFCCKNPLGGCIPSTTLYQRLSKNISSKDVEGRVKDFDTLPMDIILNRFNIHLPGIFHTKKLKKRTFLKEKGEGLKSIKAKEAMTKERMMPKRNSTRSKTTSKLKASKYYLAESGKNSKGHALSRE
jgi:hypothetical protein